MPFIATVTDNFILQNEEAKRMLIPDVFGDIFFDEMLNYPREREPEPKKAPAPPKPEQRAMKTDVWETADSYEVYIDLPGYTKDGISAKLEEGYLVVRAAGVRENAGQDREGRYVRRERYTGSCSRTFYVGDGVKPEDIRAKYENGVLRLTVPKRVHRPTEEQKHIAIED